MRAEPAEEGKFQWLARLGFAVRGLLYIVIAWLVIATGRTEDLTGTMEYLGRGVGRWLMILLVTGLTGYGASATPRSEWTAAAIIRRRRGGGLPLLEAEPSIYASRGRP